MSGTDGRRVPETVPSTHDSEFALPQPLHTTPTPTPSTSSRTDALGRGRASETKEIARLRDIHPLDALAVTVAWLRPDWNLGAIRGVLARCNGSHAELVERALILALDPDVRTPGALENAGPVRRAEPAQTYPSVHEALNPELCAHEFRVGACPVCRRAGAA